MSYQGDWMSYMWLGVSLLVSGLMLAIGLRFLRHGGGAARTIVAGGLMAGVLGIANQVMRGLFLLRLVSWDSAIEPKGIFMVTWNVFAGGFVLGQLTFLAGILLLASRLGNEKRRIAELESILNDREMAGHDPKQ